MVFSLFSSLFYSRRFFPWSLLFNVLSFIRSISYFLFNNESIKYGFTSSLFTAFFTCQRYIHSIKFYEFDKYFYIPLNGSFSSLPSLFISHSRRLVYLVIVMILCLQMKYFDNLVLFSIFFFILSVGKSECDSWMEWKRHTLFWIIWIGRIHRIYRRLFYASWLRKNKILFYHKNKYLIYVNRICKSTYIQSLWR